MITVISVRCRAPDELLHLAPFEAGSGTSVFTLCLERWSKQEVCREDSELCPICVRKWKEKNR